MHSQCQYCKISLEIKDNIMRLYCDTCHNSTITQQQLLELKKELIDIPDLIPEILNKFNIPDLSKLPLPIYYKVMERIKQIKRIKNKESGINEEAIPEEINKLWEKKYGSNQI